MSGTRVGSAFGANRANHANDANDAIEAIARREGGDGDGREGARVRGAEAVRAVGARMRPAGRRDMPVAYALKAALSCRSRLMECADWRGGRASASFRG